MVAARLLVDLLLEGIQNLQLRTTRPFKYPTPACDMEENVGPKLAVSRPEWTSEDQIYISDKAKDLLVNYSGILDTNIRRHSVAIVRLLVTDVT